MLANPEPDVAATGPNSLAHGLDDPRQFVGPNVRVRVHQDVRIGAMFHEPSQGGEPGPALLGPGVELAV